MRCDTMTGPTASMPPFRTPGSTPAAAAFPWRHLLAVLLALLGLGQARIATAQVMADWGTIATPIASDTTFSFAQYDINHNFTHQYQFSLEGTADATYTVTFNFDACTRGCGNPSFSYGIYDLNGGLLDPLAGGTYVLTAGAYAFQVKGDGFGAGNSIDYWGAVTIAGAPASTVTTAAAPAGTTTLAPSPSGAEIVSPAPEPETLWLLGPGLLFIAWVARRRKALIVPVALALQACNGAPAPTPSQVVARVNGVEISVHQVEHAARVERSALAAAPDPAALTEKLIDRELAVQKALEQKLDRQIEVLQRLEEMRRDVLANAYAESLAGSLAKPSRGDVERFFASHPELFAQRKIYRLREFATPAGTPAANEAKKRFAARESMDEIARALSRSGTRATVQDVLRAAEQLPMQALERLHGTPEGQVALFESPRVLYAYQVLGAQSAPFDLAAATPLIAEHLARRAGQEAMAAQLKVLRSSAVIERAASPAATPDRVVASN